VILTHVLKKLITFIKHEHLQVLHLKGFVTCQSQNTAGGADDNVGRIITFKQFYVGVDWLASIDDFTADVLGELGEAVQLIFDLISELSCVAKDDCTAGLGVVTQVLKDCQKEHCCLSHAGNGLAQNVDAEDGFWDASLLHIGGVLKTAINDSLLQRGFEEHVFEACRVHTCVSHWLGSASSIYMAIGVVIWLKYIVFVVGEFSCSVFFVLHLSRLSQIWLVQVEWEGGKMLRVLYY